MIAQARQQIWTRAIQRLAAVLLSGGQLQGCRRMRRNRLRGRHLMGTQRRKRRLDMIGACIGLMALYVLGYQGVCDLLGYGEGGRRAAVSLPQSLSLRPEVPFHPPAAAPATNRPPQQRPCVRRFARASARCWRGLVSHGLDAFPCSPGPSREQGKALLLTSERRTPGVTRF